MTVPTVRATALLNDNSSATTATQSGTIPASVQDGDYGLLVAVEGTGANTVTTPTGWTLLGGPLTVDSNNTIYVFGREMLASDAGDPVSVVWSGSGKGCGVLQVWQDTDPAFLGTANNPQAAGGTSLTIGTIITNGPDCGVAQFIVARSATTTPPNITWPAGYTEAGEADTSGASPNFVVSGAYLTGGKAVGGLTGGETATCSQTASGAHTFTVSLYPVATNTAPTAGAGTDQVVDSGDPVTLTGSDSDTDGTIASRLWTQLTGTTVTLSGDTTATATFTAPTLPSGGSDEVLTFQYEVTDDDGATDADTVQVTVTAPAAGTDNGLRVYVVSASGVKQECAVYVVDALGAKQQIATKG